jgi:hypothetical protein
VRSQSDDALFWKISGGDTREGMPTFSFLPEAQGGSLSCGFARCQAGRLGANEQSTIPKAAVAKYRCRAGV